MGFGSGEGRRVGRIHGCASALRLSGPKVETLMWRRLSCLPRSLVWTQSGASRGSLCEEMSLDAAATSSRATGDKMARLSTHVLDMARGIPAVGVRVELHAV